MERDRDTPHRDCDMEQRPVGQMGSHDDDARWDLGVDQVGDGDYTDGSTLYHTHSFTQKRNFHFRVRAQNAKGYGA